MRKNESSLNKFNQIIQSKMNDNQWDNFIANQVIYLKHEQNKRKLQLTLMPLIVLTATTIYFSGFFSANTSTYENRLAKQKENQKKTQKNQQFKKHQKQQNQRQFEDYNNQDYIIETVFTQLK